MERDKMQTDLSALFMPRQPLMSAGEAVSGDIHLKSSVVERRI